MRFPSLKALKEIHDADHEKMCKIGKMSRAQILKASEKAEKDDRSSFGRMPTSYLRLIALDEAARTHGVEVAETKGGEYAEYLNTGDTYHPTVIRWRGKYRIQSLGDFVEALERRGIFFK